MSTTGTGQPTSNVLHDRRAVGEGNGGIKETLRDSTYRSIDGQKERASETLGNLAGAVRGMTEPLREGGQQQMADYVNRAADGIERWASQLRQQELEDAVRAVEQFARRQPAMFLGLAFGAGIVAARFLKSSGGNGATTRDYRDQFNPAPSAGPTSYGASGVGDTGFSSGTRGFETPSELRSDIPRTGAGRSTGEVI